MNHPLLSAILAYPRDLDRRLIYADALEEEGQGDRAEFIRLQLALADEPHEPALCNVTGVCGACNRVMGLRRREWELLEANSRERPGFNNRLAWAGPVEQVCRITTDAEFRRGFVESITLTTADFIQHGPQIVLAQPVVEVVLSDREPTRHMLYGTWFWVSETGWDGPSADELPPDLFNCLPSSRSPCHLENEPGDWRSYPTREAALQALSTAAVRWARREAGLPELE